MTSIDLKSRAKELWHEGSIRRVRVYKAEKDLVSLPLNIAVICALIVPWLIIGGALVALLFGCSMEIKNEEDDDETPPAPSEPLIPHDDI